MAKTEKSNKKVTSKKPDPTKGSPAVVLSSKEILAKAKAAQASKVNGKKKPSSDDSSESSSEESDSDSDDNDEVAPPAKSIPTPVKKASQPSDNSSDSSSSEESSSDESDNPKRKSSLPAKASPAKIHPEKVKDAVESSDESSNSSGSDDEESDEDQEMTPGPAVTSNKGKEAKSPDSEDDSSDSSSESSSEESDDEEDAKTPIQPTPEVSKKRKADVEASAPQKKVKFVDGAANGETLGEETKSIFVGSLSWNVDNDWLAQEFAECGEVESAHVQMDRNTGRSRGFGYVHFKTADAVEKALGLKGKEIDGRAINVDRSTPPDKKASQEKRARAFGDTSSPPSSVLFVGNLSFGVDEDTLWETFGEHGDIKSVRVPTDRETGKPKGFAYVEFGEIGAAKKAHGALQGFELSGRSLRLDFSQPRDSAGGRGGGQGARGGRGGWGDRGRGGFGAERGRGGGRGGRGGDRGGRGRGRGRGARTGGITNFEGQKITFD